ncbi:MAG: 50S ribosomal protein L19e [Candidatus Methanofastidiosia archaeon]
MNLKVQRRLASQILKCGENRIFLDGKKAEEISMAITREDVRRLIKKGLVYKKPKKGISSFRDRFIKKQKKKGRRKGAGSRKGTFKARYSKKKRWMDKIRPIRRELKELRRRRKIEKSSYQKLYRMAKGGTIKSVKHLNRYIEEHGLTRRRRG